MSAKGEAVGKAAEHVIAKAVESARPARRPGAMRQDDNSCTTSCTIRFSRDGKFMGFLEPLT